MKDKQAYSNSWDRPALIDNQDGVKTSSTRRTYS